MILACGEALIDMLPNADHPHLIEPVTGGSVFNTAIALGRLGATAGFFCGLSTDKFGRLLQADLEDSGVDHSHCARSSRPTTLAVVDLDDGEATYTFYDEGSAGRMLSKAELPEVPSDVHAMVFGGICLIPEPCGSAYETLLQQNAPNKITYLDPNIRANFIEDADGHRARIQRMVTNCDIVKVSGDDLAWVEPEKSEAEAVSGWLDGGTKIVLLSRGGDGAEAHTVNGMISVPAVPIEVADTVGAGDTFNAGFLTSLTEQGVTFKSDLASISEDKIKQALMFAARVAAVTASRVGANPPWRKEL